MTNKKLTFNDLFHFCQEHKIKTFSSKKEGYPLSVQIPTTFEIDEGDQDDDHRGMLKLKFRILHDGLNRNGSFVSNAAAKKASKTISDRPIMATIHQLDDGTWDFKSHDVEIIENENGEVEFNYVEKQVGSFSSEKPFWEYDEETDKNYLCAYGYVAEEYTKAADIIRTKGWTKNSCELCIEEMAYNAKEKYLELKSFYIAASTLLGSEDDGTPIGEGMLGSRADIVEFSQDNNSILSNQTLEIMQGLKESLDNYISAFAETKNQGKEETENVDNFEENVEVTETTDAVEEATTEEESTEEVTVTEDESNDDVTPSEDFSEVKRPKDPGPNSDEDDSDYDIVPEPIEQSDNDDMIIIPEDPKDDNTSTDQNNTDQTNTNTTEPDNTNTNTTDATTTDPDPSDNNLSDPTDNDQPLSYSVNFNGVTKDFSVSLTEKLNALYQLVNDTYAEADNDFYNVDAFEENKTVLMHGFFSGKSYRQKYATKKDVYSLQGDRVEVFATYLTRDEQAQLENMKSSYSEIETELNKFKAEPEKMEILNSEDYSSIAGSDEFVEFKKQDAHFDMTVDEVRAKADEMLLNAAKHGNVEFAKVEPKTVEMKKIIPASKKRSGRYGNLFNK